MMNKVLLILLVVLSPSLLSAQDKEFEKNISVTGQGSAYAPPDTAYIIIGALGRDTSPQKAMETVAAASKTIIELAEKYGVPANKVQTSNLNLHIDHMKDNRGGYLARTDIRIEFKKLDKVGAFIGEAVNMGANTLNGVSFELSNRDAILKEARKRAFNDAKTKALQLAELAGVTLGEVINISETASYAAPYSGSVVRAAGMESDLAVSAGEVQSDITLNVKFSLK